MLSIHLLLFLKRNENHKMCQQKFLKHKLDGLNVILDSLQQKYFYVGYYLLVR